MRYEGNAPQYSAFAIVAIESVWPNPEGTELSPNDADMSLIGAESKPYKSTIRPGVNDTVGVASEEDYQEKQGYYKILPLNVVRVETSTSVNGGSGFSVAFTLDDLLLVLPKGSESAFRYATGLPISRNDLIESDFENALPQLLDPISPDGSNEADWKYVKDDDLGLSRYRISGSQSAFNVEDLVDVNDTVTIWIYHDPQDFYLKDDVPSFDNDDFLQNESNEIKGIIGSGDRQNQFSTGERDFDETMLFNLGLVNDIVKEAVELESVNLGASEEEDVNPIDQINTVSQENLSDVLLVMSQEAGTGVLPETAYVKIQDYVAASFPEADETQRQYIVDILATLRRIDPATYIPVGVLSPEAPAFQGRINTLNSVIQNLEVDQSTGDFLLLDSTDEADVLNTQLVKLRELGFEDPNKAILSLNILKNSVNDKARAYANNYLARRGQTTVSQVFSNGRKVLLNGAHGETPYLALKGVVSSISTSIGTTDGTYLVTLSGSGYEKVLTSNEVFYEDLLYPEATYAPLTDYNTVYMNMSPPRAIQQIISRWAARQVVFGKPTSYSILAFNRSLWLRKAYGDEDPVDTDESEQNVFNPKFPGQEDGNVPIRGTFVYSDYVNSAESEQPEFLRVFSPINYLDITRIREMSTTLDKSYRDPTVEGAINTAQNINGRESIMNNLRRVGGVADFYEMFVDESGRFRYRLKFEAIERTPDTGVTPIIQDYEIMASGTSFSVDDSQLSTIVDVSPILTRQVTTFGGLAFIGRSVPPSGKMPIDSIEEDIPPESLAPELFKYGLRTMQIQDLYQSERGGAKRKAHLYRMFYGKPLKKATVRLRNNTSFRAGETVLLSLQKNKKRSRTVFDVNKMIEWLNYILTDQELLEMYIGVEKRFLQPGKDSYFYTTGESILPIPNTDMYDLYNRNPHEFVANAFLRTFEFLRDSIPNINVFTPEYFPTTYWYHQKLPGGFKNWDQGNIKDQEIIDVYSTLIKSATYGYASSKEVINQLLSLDRNQGIINAVKFQNFRASSYYIEGVAHRFSYAAAAETVLNLNYGQDNLVLLEPKSFLPIGFISIEKKMKIGYDDTFQQDLWEEYLSERSAMQNMYINQFQEDKKYKEASFLHNSQYFRNSSNYMYELANFYDPIDTGLSYEPPDVSESETLQTTERSARELGRGVVGTEIIVPPLSDAYIVWRDGFLGNVRTTMAIDSDLETPNSRNAYLEVVALLENYRRFVSPEKPTIPEVSEYIRDNFRSIPDDVLGLNGEQKAFLRSGNFETFGRVENE
jgi:hypothetical protein